jgi:hypothetical protein
MQQPQMQQQTWTGIQVETSYFPLAFLLALCTTTIVVDGVAYRRPWGKHFFPVAPGWHNVRIFFRYLFMEQCGDNSVNVMVQPGYVSSIKFEMPPWMFSKGSIKELPPYMPR